MRNRLRLISMFGVVVTPLLTVPAWAGEWELVFETENLRVERRDYQASQLDEIRGVTRVEASLNAVMALLKDAEFNSEWVYRSGGARILQEDDYRQAYVYGIVDAPWPMQDRDTVVRFDYQQQPTTKEIVITISNFPDFIPAENALVRVPEFGGFWKLKPEKDGRVEVTYQVHGDPGGWIPVWLANRAAEISVQYTLQKMPAAVTRYAGAKSALVEEAAVPSH